MVTVSIGMPKFSSPMMTSTVLSNALTGPSTRLNQEVVTACDHMKRTHHQIFARPHKAIEARMDCVENRAKNSALLDV